MMKSGDKKELIAGLQQQILSMQGYRNKLEDHSRLTGLGQIQQAFPQRSFPLGAVHEFLSYEFEDAAATNGFIAALISKLNASGICLWVGTRRKIFPSALQLFGIDPDRVVFIDTPKQKEALWTMEEALKCDGLSVVIGEFNEMSFMQSRRLQLAVEQSRVTGFIHRFQPRMENTVACVSRWKVKPISSIMEDDLPGIGFSRWNVALQKVRNGRPGAWQLEWANNELRQIQAEVSSSIFENRKTG